MKSVLLVGSIEALFLILLLLKKKDKSVSDLFLSIIFFANALTLSLAYFEILNHENAFKHPAIINTSWMFLLLHGPAIWFYVRSIGNPGFKLKLSDAIHLAPFLGLSIYHVFDFMLLPDNEKVALTVNEDFTNLVFYKVAVICIGLSNIIYNILALLSIKKLERKVKMVYSNLKNANLKWMKIITIASLAVYFINSGLFNLDLFFNIGSYKNLLLISYIYGTVYIFILGYFGLQQKNVFLNIYYPESTLIRQKTYPNIEKNHEVEMLISYMKNEKPFLDPEINISKLAIEFNTTPEKLSKTLNKQIGESFFCFINKFRIEEFKTKILQDDKKRYSILGIAYDCGFNSKAAFYRAFKKFENKSPGEFINSALQKSETKK